MLKNNVRKENIAFEEGFWARLRRGRDFIGIVMVKWVSMKIWPACGEAGYPPAARQGFYWNSQRGITRKE
jgi:hypothetical protein